MFEWLFYNTFIPLLPAPLVIFGSWLVGDKTNLFSVIRDGQLCFYCTAISAVAIRDILISNTQKTIGYMPISIGGILFCIILSTFSYGIAVTSEQADDNKLAITSLAASITTTIIVATTRLYMGLL